MIAYAENAVGQSELKYNKYFLTNFYLTRIIYQILCIFYSRM